MNLKDTFHNREWRLNKLYSIIDKQSNRCTFKQNFVQRKISQSKSKRKMVLKARQFGVSTNGLIEMFDDAITTQNLTCCILAHEQDSIKKLFRIIHRAYNYLHPKLKPVIDRGGGSKYEMFFPVMNSRIYCDLESRGDTIHRLHVSEAAFIKDPDKLKATLQAVPIETGVVQIESTPNGMGNLFYDMWMDQDQPYEKLFFPWYVFPEYAIETDLFQLTEDEKKLYEKVLEKYQIKLTHAQFAFRRYKQKELGSLFLQEYPEDDQTCFLSSGSSAMDLHKVVAHRERKRDPIYQDKELKIFEKYVKDRRYVCGVDCAEGYDGDYSVATVFDARNREQVAILRGHIKPHEFAKRIYELCDRYSFSGRPPPLLAIERNLHGHAVLLELEHHLRYPNLYQHKDEKLGWLTDKVTRPIMVDAFIDGVENQSIRIHDTETFNECLTLIDEDGKIEAAPGKHDDCIIACAIALQMCIQSATSEIYDNVSDYILV